MENAIRETRQEWSEVISPKTGWFDIKWKELWHYKDLMLLFVKRDFVSQYKQTILGPVWHFIQPILTTLMFMVIFKRVANIPTDNIPSTLFYMSGITMWNYFATCLTGTSNTFVANASIFGKVYFPRLVLPLATVISNIVKFGIQFLLLVTALAIFAIKGKIGFTINVYWLMIPVLVIIMAGMGLGIGIMISSLTTKYRDFSVLVSFGIQLAMYATPVVYPMSFLMQKSQTAASFLKWNPMAPVVEGFRYCFFHLPNQQFQFASLAYSFVFMVIVLLLGMSLFNKVEKGFMDTV